MALLYKVASSRPFLFIYFIVFQGFTVLSQMSASADVHVVFVCTINSDAGDIQTPGADRKKESEREKKIIVYEDLHTLIARFMLPTHLHIDGSFIYVCWVLGASDLA